MRLYMPLLSISGNNEVQLLGCRADNPQAVCPLLLQKSKSVAKRQREEAEETKADKAAKKMRLEMKQRGHVVRYPCTLRCWS